MLGTPSPTTVQITLCFATMVLVADVHLPYTLKEKDGEDVNEG